MYILSMSTHQHTNTFHDLYIIVPASYPGSAQFFNDACRKMREPGKIHHVCDITWKGAGAVCAYTSEEKHGRKTPGLESPATDMVTRAKTARNVSIPVTFCVLDF